MKPIAILLELSVILAFASLTQSLPNVVFIVADDLGWNDVGWHNPEIPSPHLDKLARQGVILNRSYVQPLCTPSRSAFLTGMYPFHTGLQHDVIYPRQPEGVPTHLHMLPRILKDQAGYATHIVGKWHLGFCKWDFTPTRRGFDTFLGYYSGRLDYYSHSRTFDEIGGYDFRDNDNVAYAYNGTYSAHVFGQRAVRIIQSHDKKKPLFMYLAFQNVHNPLQVPESYAKKCNRIRNSKRRMFCGMVNVLDEAVKNVTDALESRAMSNNTVIIFTTDNGGDTEWSSSNLPLRGGKSTLLEGGTRGVAFVSGPPQLLPLRGYTNNHMMHAVDWYPTILQLANININTTSTLDYKLDGISQLQSLQRNVSVRREFVYNLDEMDRTAAIRLDNYKLIVEEAVPDFESWTFSAGFSNGSLLELRKVLPKKAVLFNKSKHVRVQLYDVQNDPGETTELSKRMPEITKRLLSKLSKYRESLVAGQASPPHPKSHPKFWNGVWSPGWCADTDSRFKFPKQNIGVSLNIYRINFYSIIHQGQAWMVASIFLLFLAAIYMHRRSTAHRHSFSVRIIRSCARVIFRATPAILRAARQAFLHVLSKTFSGK